MSSTNRGSDRNISDYYITPQKSILEFLNAWNEDMSWVEDISGKTILDPCAGGDSLNEMSYPKVLSQYNLACPIITVDKRLDSKAMYKEDFLNFQPSTDIHLIISNPPFCDALQFIKHSLTISKLYVVFLLRLNFFGSQERSEWFKSHMPVSTYVHSKRMRFTSMSGTDSIEYMHCVWQVGVYPKFTQLRVI